MAARIPLLQLSVASNHANSKMLVDTHDQTVLLGPALRYTHTHTCTRMYTYLVAFYDHIDLYFLFHSFPLSFMAAISACIGEYATLAVCSF